MTRTRIKFCGLTREGDVAAACRLGVDAVGFVCHPASPRYVAVERLAALARELGPFVTPVLLFVDADPARIRQAREFMPDALLQFHGRESAAACAAFGRPYLRAIALGAGVDLLDCEIEYRSASALLVDAPPREHEVGGGGRTFDWSLVPAPGRRSRPLILAGGLTPANVEAAISAVHPYALDVSSGIESSRGIKSEALMTGFVAAVRAADRRAAATGDA